MNINSLSKEEKFALFYGILLGDGCLSHYFGKDKKEYFTVTITGHNPDDLPFYKEVIAPLLFSFGRRSASIKRRKDCNAIEFNFSNKSIFAKVASYGFPVGKKGAKLFIPKEFYEKGLVGFVVAGFVATDGSLVLTKNPNKYYPRVEGNGICRVLIKEITDYLVSQGLFGKFYRSKRRQGSNFGYGAKLPWRFQFNGKKNLILFNEKIGFANPKHYRKFLNFLRYDEEYDKNIRGTPCIEHYRIRNKVKL
ncbi:hypothetical protein CMI41_01535 [Candidatus Pacearchaeota archaeon]|nr:hypothetical protein [Candidatus Pacearchaeota archaeon]|tara:strand:+ start:968 stop:1717 length:750 start_codon:yes stop_codon:yes gene_type:complete